MNGSNLHTHFRCRKKHTKRSGVPKRGGHIKNCICITKRPLVVEHLRTGDWEDDTVPGSGEKGEVIVTLAERKSRYCVIVVSQDRKASSVSRAVLKAAAPVRNRFETVTCDNAKEFLLHEKLSRELSAKWYLAHPYRSWERRYCENTNGLIRQQFPERMGFGRLKQEGANRVMDKLNNGPMKYPGFKTPDQVFFGTGPPVAFQA